MKIVAIATVKNETDIIEAMIRHNLAFVDRIVVLDNDSTDGTLEILKSLSREGLSVDVEVDSTPGKYQSARVTRMMHEQAAGPDPADWIVPLDADEFLAIPAGEARLIPSDANSSVPMLIPWRVYAPNPDDESGEINPVVRIAHYLQQKTPLTKVIVPRSIAANPQSVIPQGSHEVLVDGMAVAAAFHPYAILAHYPVRSPGQWVAKVVINSLQYRAMGAHADCLKGPGYRHAWQQLRQGTIDQLESFYSGVLCYLSHGDNSSLDQPRVRESLKYAGGPLRYTAHLDDTAIAWTSLVQYATGLATRFGFQGTDRSSPSGDTRMDEAFMRFESLRSQVDPLLCQLEEKENCIQRQSHDIARLNEIVAELNVAVVAFQQASPQVSGHLIPTGAEPYPKLFIAGSPRSGTTWTQQIFAAHPAVATEVESNIFDQVHSVILRYGAHRSATWQMLLNHFISRERRDEPCGIHRYIDEADFISILDEAQDQNRHDVKWNDSSAADFVVRRVFDCFFAKPRWQGRSLLVEKTPTNIFHAHTILRLFPEAKMLVVLRDGRDVCVSMQMIHRRRDWVPPTRAGQIAMWKTYIEAGQELLRENEYGDRIETVRYEDLHDRPHETIARIYSHTGLEFDESLIDQVVRKTRFEPRQGPAAHQFWRKGVVGDWQNHFDAEDTELYRRMAGELATEIGYAA